MASRKCFVGDPPPFHLLTTDFPSLVSRRPWLRGAVKKTDYVLQTFEEVSVEQDLILRRRVTAVFNKTGLPAWHLCGCGQTGGMSSGG